MSLSETEKNGVKLVRQSSDVLFCIPPKKRHHLWLQSPGSISSSPSTCSPNACHQIGNRVQAPGLNDPGAGADTDISETANVKSSPGHDMVPTLCVSSTEASTSKLSTHDTSEAIAERGEHASEPKSLDDLSRTSEAGEECPNDQLKVQQIEDHEMKPSRQLLVSFAVRNNSGSFNSVKQETLKPSSGDAAVTEDKLNHNNLSEKSGSVELFSDRSNWDLNTAMDSWEKSFLDSDNKESPALEARMEDIDNRGSEACGNHAPNLSDSFYSESNIELKLNSTIENMNQISQVSPSSSRLNSCEDATGLNLSMSLTCTAHSTLSATIVNDKPFGPGLVDDKMNVGKQNHKPIMLKNVKNEPCEAPIPKGAAKGDVSNNLSLVHSAIVKSESQIETSQHISGKIQQEDQFSKSHSLDPLRSKHIVQEKGKTFQTPQASVGEDKNMNSLLAEVPAKGIILQTDIPQPVGLNLSMESISKVKLELPESSKLGTNVDVTGGGCSITGEDLVNPGIGLDSKLPPGTDCAGLLSECSGTIDKLALLSESPSALPTDDSENDVSQFSPGKFLDSSIRGQVDDNILDRSTELPGVDSLVPLATESLDDKEQIDSCGSKVVGKGKGRPLSSELFDVKPRITENSKSPGDLLPSQVISRQYDDGDDIEDGEVRDAQQAAVKNLLPGSEIKNEHDGEVTSFVEPVPHPTVTLNETERVNETQNLPEVQRSTADFAVNMHDKNMSSVRVMEEQGPSTPKLPPIRDPSKKKAVKTECLDHAIKNSELKFLPNKSSNESNGLPTKDNAGEVDSYKMSTENSLPFPADSKTETMSKSDGPVHMSKKVILTSKDSSSERTKPSDRKWVSPKSEREKSSDQSVKGDGPQQRGNRDETCNNGTLKIEKEWKNDETARKAGSEYMQNGRAERVFHNDRNPEVGYVYSHRFARHKNIRDLTSTVSTDCAVENAGRVLRSLPEDDIGNFSRVPSRRRSPAGRERPVGRMVRRRDISPGRCIDATGSDAILLKREENFIRNLREDMLDNSTFAGPRSNFERGENSFLRRSLSPVQRRAPPRLPRVCSPSSRRRPRSPCHWSPPQRSPDDFHGHPEGIPCRSPPTALRVDRIRSPNRRDLFMEDIVGRRHASPPPQYMPRLHDGMRDVSPLRTYSFTARNGRPFQRNTRNFHLIDAEVDGEVDYFGPHPLHSGQLRELPEEDLDDSRNCNERHDLVRPPFRRYNIASNSGDEDFNFRIERNLPLRRFHPEVKEEHSERDDLHGGIRHRIGEMPRRLRAVEERGDVIQHDGGQGWPDPSFSDVRMKRRRF